MLTSILPGLRELRAPLAAGYLWLLAAWLAFGSHIPSREDATGVLESIYRLDDIVSAFGIVTASSFAAYLLGSVSEAAFGGLVRRLEDRLSFQVNRSIGPAREYGWLIWLEGRKALESVVRRAIEQATARGQTDALRTEIRKLSGRPRPLRSARLGAPTPPPTEGAEVGLFGPPDSFTWCSADRREGERARRAAQGCHRRAAARGAAARRRARELFSAADRLRAEAEFRSAVAPPLLVALGILAVTQSLWSFLGVPAVALLYAQGISRRQQRNAVLADALLLGRVEAPTLERIRETLKRPDREE